MSLPTTLVTCHALSLLATVFLSGLPFGASLLFRTASVLVTPIFGPCLLLRTGFGTLAVVWLPGFGTRLVAPVLILSSLIVLPRLSTVFIFIFIFVFRFFVLRVIGPVGALLRKCGR
jgi:hypothetical protein